MWDPRLAVRLMAWRSTVPISIRAPSRRSPSFRPCNMLGLRERLAVTLQAARLVRRSPVHIAADRSRVVTRLFVPGNEGFDEQESRSSAVLRRVLALTDDEVQRSLDDVMARFKGRHHCLTDTFLRHADELSDRLDPEAKFPEPTSPSRGDLHE